MPRRINSAFVSAAVRALALALVPVLALVFAAGCASKRPSPGMASVEGTLRTLPREGIEPQSAAGSYGDRRVRDARLVDYDRPGFAVVSVETAAPDVASGEAIERLTIRDGSVGVRFGPAQSAVRAGRSIEIHNASHQPHILSVPTLGLVRELAPRDALTVELTRAGAHTFFLLDMQGAEALVYAAPGPFSVVSSRGDFAIGELQPGTHLLRVWHPRLPPTTATVQLEADHVTRVDLTLGVGHSNPTHHEADAGGTRP